MMYFWCTRAVIACKLNKKLGETRTRRLKNDISRGQKRVKSNNELNDTMCNVYRVVQLVKLFQRDYLKRGVSVASPSSILEINVIWRRIALF